MGVQKEDSRLQGKPQLPKDLSRASTQGDPCENAQQEFGDVERLKGGSEEAGSTSCDEEGIHGKGW